MQCNAMLCDLSLALTVCINGQQPMEGVTAHSDPSNCGPTLPKCGFQVPVQQASCVTLQLLLSILQAPSLSVESTWWMSNGNAAQNPLGGVLLTPALKTAGSELFCGRHVDVVSWQGPRAECCHLGCGNRHCAYQRHHVAACNSPGLAPSRCPALLHHPVTGAL